MGFPVDEKIRLALAKLKSISDPVVKYCSEGLIGTYGFDAINPFTPTRFPLTSKIVGH